MTFPKRGQIYWVNLDPTVGSEIKKNRPAVIVSNDINNRFSSRVIVAPITSNTKKIFPFEAPLTLAGKKGKILLDQIRAIDKKRLGSFMALCELETISQIDGALKIVLALH